MGAMASIHAPSTVVRGAMAAFVRTQSIDLEEAVVPEGGFTTFNALFTRQIRPETRPLCEDHNALLCPADGRLDDFGPIDDRSHFVVKGTAYDLRELLGSVEQASRFRGGSFATIYLAPRDYHRVHASASGEVTRVHHLPGTLLPVNSIGFKYFPGLFARNERVAVLQQTAVFGEVCTILVGAMGVGNIALSFDELVTNVRGAKGGARTYPLQRPHLARGDELGLFRLGSTVLVFTSLPALAWEYKVGDPVRMGTALARRIG